MIDFITVGQDIAGFMLVMAFLVGAHEGGHFLVARWCGVRVETFSIGFGPALARWTDRHGTVWKFSAVPFGGYVRMHGQTRQKRQYGLSDKGAFYAKRVGARAAIVAAGPVANILLAVLLMTVLGVVIGRVTVLPIIAKVNPGSPAAQAGLQPGDRVVAADSRPVHEFQDLVDVINQDTPVTGRPPNPIRILVRRVGRIQDVIIQPKMTPGHVTPEIGIWGTPGTIRLPPVAAMVHSLTVTGKFIKIFTQNVVRTVMGRESTRDLSGPIGIAVISGRTFSQGISSIAILVSLLSLNLGLVNLLPIPILDGGHLMFFMIEAVLGRPIPDRVTEYGLRFGVVVILGLFAMSTWNDIGRLGVFHWFGG